MGNCYENDYTVIWFWCNKNNLNTISNQGAILQDSKTFLRQLEPHKNALPWSKRFTIYIMHNSSNMINTFVLFIRCKFNYGKSCWFLTTHPHFTSVMPFRPSNFSLCFFLPVNTQTYKFRIYLYSLNLKSSSNFNKWNACGTQIKRLFSNNLFFTWKSLTSMFYNDTETTASFERLLQWLTNLFENEYFLMSSLDLVFCNLYYLNL